MVARRTSLLARSLLLASLLPAAVVGCKRTDAPAPAVTIVRYDVQGMHCEGCVNAITDKVLKVKGVASCEVSLEEHRATVGLSDASKSGEVEAAIAKLGYTVGAPGAPSDAAPAEGTADQATSPASAS